MNNHHVALTSAVEEARIKQEVYDLHIAPYIARAEQSLFDAFCSVSANDKDQLALIKMQHTVLKGLEADFVRIAENGKLARHELLNPEI